MHVLVRLRHVPLIIASIIQFLVERFARNTKKNSRHRKIIFRISKGEREREADKQ